MALAEQMILSASCYKWHCQNHRFSKCNTNSKNSALYRNHSVLGTTNAITRGLIFAL